MPESVAEAPELAVDSALPEGVEVDLEVEVDGRVDELVGEEQVRVLRAGPRPVQVELQQACGE